MDWGFIGPAFGMFIALIVVIGKVIVQPVARAIARRGSGEDRAQLAALTTRLEALEARIEQLDEGQRRLLEVQEFQRRLLEGRSGPAAP
jgi:cell division protein FtsB